MAVYRRTKIYRNGKLVGYKYPNSASRNYYESKYKKASANGPVSGKGRKPPISKKPIKTGGNTGVEQGRHFTQTDTRNNPAGRGVTPKTPKPVDTTPPKFKQPVNKGEGLFKAMAGRQRDGGPVSSPAIKPRQMNFNLSNDEDLAQGSETQWSTPTSISHLISGQLRQAAWSQEDAFLSLGRNTQAATSNPMGAFATPMVMNDYGNMEMEEAPDDYEEMTSGPASGKGSGIPRDHTGMVSVKTDDGITHWYKAPTVSTTGAFPTYMAGWDSNGGFKSAADKDRWLAMDPKGYFTAMDKANDAMWSVYDSIPEDAEDTTSYDQQAQKAYNQIFMGAYSDFYNSKVPAGSKLMKYDDAIGLTTFVSGSTGAAPDAYTPPNAPVGGSVTPTDNDVFGQASSQLYNPWSRLEGGSTNSYGPSGATLDQGTQQAMALANAYFAPQRAELAYELGDMETDMRRMAVNLGRQIDDPILQAKLYKEASRAVRTMDIQQNTLAFQMADQRRKEDIANYQFYDQLASQEAQLKLANRQFYDKFDLDKRYYNLENWNAQQAYAQGANQPAPAKSAGEQQQAPVTYGNLLNGYKPY